MKRLGFLLLPLSLLVLSAGCAIAPAPTPPQVTPPVIVAYSSNPSAISSGGTSTLLWNVTGATSVSIDQGIGQVDVAGTRVVSPATSSVYTISATNSAGTVTESAVTTVNSAPPPSPIAFSVTSVTANTESSTGACPFTLYANITANGPGTVTYIWEETNGAGYSYTFSITFPTAGTQKITLPLEMSGLPSSWYRVRVLTPNDAVSNPTYYTNCAP